MKIAQRAVFTAHGATVEECVSDAHAIAEALAHGEYVIGHIEYGPFVPEDTEVLSADDRTVRTEITRWAVDCRVTLEPVTSVDPDVDMQEPTP